jgi:gamma-glutamylcyclotransferase (GGCT)/AIG2-like uncharacterized protein YtfP
MSNLFSYGSLMFPDVLAQVIGHTPLGHHARLDGWIRRAIIDQTYPAAIPIEGGCMTGVLWHDLSDADWQALDRFEGEEYRRVLVHVMREDGGRYPAYVYQWLDVQRIGDHDWSQEDFNAQHREDFFQLHGHHPGGSCRGS